MAAPLADEQLIVRVVQNLVANAIKFSSQGTRVFVSVSTLHDAATNDQPFVMVSVRDQGVGIAPQNLSKLFTKFSQVGDRRGGTGLGLAFCKLVVEAHQGRMGVESSVGEGSTFYFLLPLAAAIA
jgi:signal transduction histidine kinase